MVAMWFSLVGSQVSHKMVLGTGIQPESGPGKYAIKRDFSI